MKKNITLFLFILILKVVPAYAQDLQYVWAFGLGATTSIFTAGTDLTVDALGNTYLLGAYSGTVDFDFSSGIANLPSSSANGNLFIAKYGANGNYLWAKNVGEANGTCIVQDNAGNIYIAGFISDTVDFDPGPGVDNLNTGSRSMFIAKYDQNGNYLWARCNTSIGKSVATCNSIAIDKVGNAYVTGSYRNIISFGLEDTLISNGGNKDDIFIAKFDASGNNVWAKGIGGSGADHGTGIALDSRGNVCVTGSFSAMTDFDPGAGITMVPANRNEAFVAKYNSSGGFLWANGMGGLGDDGGADISLDASDNIYVTGAFSLTSNFDPVAGTSSLTSKGNLDIFIAKYDSGGNYVWAKGIGGNQDESGQKILNIGAILYVVGSYNDSVDFDPGIGTTTLTSSGGSDMFMAKYDINGNFLWAGSIGSKKDEMSSCGIAVDSINNVYWTGSFWEEADVDPGPGIISLPVVGYYPSFKRNAFLLKLHSDCTQFLTFNESACDSFVFHGKAYTASGKYIDTIKSGDCDSILTLNLVITGKTSLNPIVKAHFCDSVVLNGVTYTSSGKYIEYYTNVSGCDSNITYELTIGQSSNSRSVSNTVCDRFVVNDTLVFDKTGFQILTFTNASGCDSPVVFDITVNPSPEASISSKGTTLTASNGSSFQWINCKDRNGIPAAIKQEYTVTETGSYAVIVTLANCNDTSDCVYVEVTNNEIDEKWVGSDVQLYPNPTCTQITIQSKSAWNNARISLLNILGQPLLVQDEVKGNSCILNLAPYPTGVFFVEIREDSKVLYFKVIKE